MTASSHIGWPARKRVPAVLILIGIATAVACSDRPESRSVSPAADSADMFNLAHLEHLAEDVQLGDSTVRIIHIYSEAPDYGWVGDDDEGIACVDDAARAAVVYLRHFELTGNRASLEKAKSLVRFVMYMQGDDGLFYNFVWDNELRINTTHRNSTATDFGWWAARAVWALGTAARVLKEIDPEFSRHSADRVRRTIPHLRSLLDRYGESEVRHGRAVPVWLIGTYGSDATSEMLLGLNALNAAYPSADVRETIERFADGIMRMQYGSMSDFPYGAHASYVNEWHAWGNSQTQALSEAGITSSAVREAEHFYPRLLIEGWLHSFRLDDPDTTRRFSQIAYAVRCVAVGLVRLYEATGDVRYARMAALAASWFAGNNPAAVMMYDPDTGRGFDGINGPESVNRNAGAESTIEALMTMLEVEHVDEARPWMHTRGSDPAKRDRGGETFLYRVLSTTGSDAMPARRLGLAANLTAERLHLFEGDELEEFLREVSP